jgi:hypothetical protein
MKEAEQAEAAKKIEEAKKAEQELFMIPPMDKKMKAAVAGFVTLVIALCIVSFQNTRNYYVKDNGFAVQIWQGTFSPLNSEMILQLPGAVAPEAIKNRYDRKEALSIAFSYYLQKAAELSESGEVPDMEQVREALLRARSVATSSEQKKEADDKLALIDKTVQTFKDSFSGKSMMKEKSLPKAKEVPEKKSEPGHH